MHRDFIREAEIDEEHFADFRGELAEMACCVADPDACDDGGEDYFVDGDDEGLPDTLREPETQPSPSQIEREHEAPTIRGALGA